MTTPKIHEQVTEQNTSLRGEATVMVNLLTECAAVISTVEGESTTECEMLDSLREQVSAVLKAVVARGAA